MGMDPLAKAVLGVFRRVLSYAMRRGLWRVEWFRLCLDDAWSVRRAARLEFIRLHAAIKLRSSYGRRSEHGAPSIDTRGDRRRARRGGCVAERDCARQPAGV